MCYTEQVELEELQAQPLVVQEAAITWEGSSPSSTASSTRSEISIAAKSITLFMYFTSSKEPMHHETALDGCEIPV